MTQPPPAGPPPQPFGVQVSSGSRRGGTARLDIVCVVAVGGAIGASGRYLLSQSIPRSPGGFPWPTFIANVTGCFLLAALMVVLLEVLAPKRYVRPFFGVGVLGGFTTYSTYTAETRELLATGRIGTAALYLFGSVVAGLLAVAAGIWLARAVSAWGGGPRRGPAGQIEEASA